MANIGRNFGTFGLFSERLAILQEFSRDSTPRTPVTEALEMTAMPRPDQEK
jgi:hypothetical protein